MFHRLTGNVVVQDRAGPDGAVAAEWARAGASAPHGGGLTHIVQFYRGDEQSVRIQARTAETMRRAATGTDVRLVTVPLAGEAATVPEGFVASRPLQRDVRSRRRFAVPRRLPLLFDILRAGADTAGNAGHLVFTNSDICIQPQFYAAVRLLLAAGADSLVVNRRTVGDLASYGAFPDLAAAEAGLRHDGFDCFVLPAAWVAGFVDSDICVGIPLVGRALLYNMVAHADRLVILRHSALTYHYGDDRTWSDPRLDDYGRHNRAALMATMARLLSAPMRRQRLTAFLSAYGERPDVAEWDAILARAKGGMSGVPPRPRR